MTRIPTNRRPTLPGDILLHEFLEPMGISQSALAAAIGVSYQRLNGVIRGRRAMTPSTALRLARYFGTTPDVWLNLQLRADLYEVEREEREDLEAIQPLAAA
ncbi:HigA family addiction module antitoxin [Rubrivirga sp. S365]|uniref:HigA family addiction module antitoxin n=1 Tax=Rubrivirga litoralis TaxID=3075598 RepID=A0ABU3BM33_9BACT|nr:MULTISPECIES: HigA family addiction module antitoxin [unclassified Rubrivirga]MDT0630338.1 HigA family addiction module antitoxin [Rubrivirga sp. F394]MDT7855849.1 HigA family addiction module antitoxin [Rubrivirga sp. S365]